MSGPRLDAGVRPDRLRERPPGTVRLRILANLADLRLARTRVRLTPEVLAARDRSGHQVIEGVLDAHIFATIDPYRAAMHNKGIMNGVDPVIVAAGNDWRAVKAGPMPMPAAMKQ